MEDYRHSVEFSRYYCTKGWSLDKLGATNILIKQLPLIGSVIRIQRGPLSTSLEEIDEYAKSRHTGVLAIEPDITTEDTNYNNLESKLTEAGFSDLNMFLSPTKTTCIDLTKSEPDLYESFDHDIKKNITHCTDVEFKFVDTYIEFYNMLKTAGVVGRYYVQKYQDWVTQWKVFSKDLRIILAYKSDKLLGGNMFIVKKPKAFGLFLPSTEEGKKLKISASLIWEALVHSKKAECEIFDLNGLYDDRYNAPIAWKGLSQFKKKFRGHEILYMHPKAKVYSKWLLPMEKSKLLWPFFMTL